MKSLRVMSVLTALMVFSIALTIPAQGQAGRELVAAFTVDVESLDPRIAFSVQATSMLLHVYEPLLTTDENGRLQPVLAVSWELRDPKTIRFHLRQGVKFHNGKTLSGEDVKFSIESRLDPKVGSPQGSALEAVDRVDVVNANTVDVKLKQPAATSVLRTLAYDYGMIVPSGFVAPAAGQIATSYGTGPFRMVEYRPGERFVVEQNNDYWGKAPGVSRIVFRVIPEAGTRVAALERGEVDIALNFPIDQIPRARQNPSLRILSKPTVRVAFLGFRLDRKPFGDPRVRRGLAMSINRAEINRRLMGGLGSVPNTLFTPEVFGYTKDVSPPPYDPAKARQLINQAGQKGARFKFGLSNGRFQNDRQIGEAIAAFFERAGVNPEIEAPEFRTFINEIFKKESKYDAYLLSWATNTLHADFTLTPAFHEKFSVINMYRNREVSQLIDQARGITNENQALTVYRRIQAILMRDVPWVPIVSVPLLVGVRSNVEGVKLRADEATIFSSVVKR